MLTRTAVQGAAAPLTTARWAISLLLGGLALAWLLSLPAPWPARPAGPPPPADRPLPQPGGDLARGDTLLLDLVVEDASLQRQVGLISWLADGERRTSVLWLLTDGRAHRYVVPLGAHPGWRGAVTGLTLSTPPQVDTRLTVVEARLVRRPPWALDALLLAALAPLLAEPPPWPNVALAVAALLGGGLAMALPAGRRGQRLAALALGLGGAAGLTAVAGQLALLGAALAQYGGLDERAALARAPTYLEPTSLNPQLVAMHEALPAGPVLAVGFLPGQDAHDRTYAYWMRNLLAPRRVDALPAIAPPDLAARLERGDYAGLILRRGVPPPQLPGWERLSPGDAPIVAWRRAGLPALAPQQPGPAALPRLLGALALVAALGWGLAGALGWRGAERIAAGWLLGVVAAAIWLLALAAAGLPWSWLSVGLPLLGGAAAALWAGARAARIPALEPPLRSGWAPAGLLLLAGLAASAVGLAALLPFTDQDAWTNWGFKGKQFFYDGALAPTLRTYQALEPYRTGYPPAIPLLQTLGYLAAGGVSERLIKLTSPLWYLALLALLYAGVRPWASARAALGWALLLATTPAVLDHAALMNADLALALGWLLGALALARWVDAGGRRPLALGTLALICAAWVKLDGVYFGAAMLAAAAAARAWRARRSGLSVRRDIALAAAALAAFAAGVLPWQLYVAALELRSELPGAGVLAREGPAIVGRSLSVVLGQLLFSTSNSAWGLLGGGHGAIWLIAAGAVALHLRRFRRDPALTFLLLVVAGGVAFYTAIYTVRPFYSIDRYLLHLAPIALVLAARCAAPPDIREGERR